MKYLLIISLLLPGYIFSQSWKDLKKAAKKVNAELNNPSKKLNLFSENDAASALKETLSKGVEKGVGLLSIKDGFFNNQAVKIPFPPEASTIFDKLKKMGLQKELNKVVLSINRAAEDAINSAKPIFINAIKNMTIKDAINIVKGSETAGTDYLYDNTNAELVEAFKPNIKSSLNRVDATKQWKNIMSTYNKIPFVKKINPDLELYVTQKTIEGLFHILSEEEIEIRKNPQKRTSDILKKVFGNK
jgi:hypothetical protein